MNPKLDSLLPTRIGRANFVFDLIVLIVALGAGTYAVDAQWGQWLRVVFVQALILSVVWFFTATAFRHYHCIPPRRRAEQVALIAAMLLTAGASVSAAGRLFGLDATLPSLETFAFFAWPALVLARLWIFGPAYARERERRPVIIVGIGRLGRATARYLEWKAGHGRVLGYVTLPGEACSEPLSAPLLGTLTELENILLEHHAEAIYLAGDYRTQESELGEAVKLCEAIGIPFNLPIQTFGFARARAEEAGAEPADGYVHYQACPQKPYQRAWKRLGDVIAAGTALVLLSPLLTVVALAIKLTSKGPIFFRQSRLGLHGRPFAMLKFRSMVEGAERLRSTLQERNERDGPAFKISEDPRVTRVGRVLRRFSIDELPQLINVLNGDMSVVGPRPPLLAEVKQYRTWQRRRLSVRPGLTCTWQVSNRREVSFREWMLLDLRYIDHWRLLTDLMLIVRTIPFVLSGKGSG